MAFFDFNRFANEGGLQNASLFCKYYSRLEDNLYNRILLAGLKLGSKLTNDLVLRVELRKISKILDEMISFVELTPAIVDRAFTNTNRLTVIYQPILSIIEILLSSQIRTSEA